MNNHLIEMVSWMQNRYGTANPFVIAEKLNVDIKWEPFLKEPLGETTNFRGRPIILLADFIQESNQRYFVAAHELGHVIEHEDLAALYTHNRIWKGQFEHQADNFAVNLLTRLYQEENGCLPDNYYDLVHAYGFPDIDD